MSFTQNPSSLSKTKNLVASAQAKQRKAETPTLGLESTVNASMQECDNGSRANRNHGSLIDITCSQQDLPPKSRTTMMAGYPSVGQRYIKN